MATKKKTTNGSNGAGADKPRKIYPFKIAEKLSAEEQLATKDGIIQALSKIDDLEDAKKASAADWRAQIVVARTALDELRESAAGVYDDNGKKVHVREVTIDAYDDHDFRTHTVFQRRADTNEIVGNPKGRPMSQEERQVALPGVDAKKNGAAKDSGIVDDDYGKTNKERAAAKTKRDNADAADDGEK